MQPTTKLLPLWCESIEDLTVTELTRKFPNTFYVVKTPVALLPPAVDYSRPFRDEERSLEKVQIAYAALQRLVREAHDRAGFPRSRESTQTKNKNFIKKLHEKKQRRLSRKQSR